MFLALSLAFPSVAGAEFGAGDELDPPREGAGYLGPDDPGVYAGVAERAELVVTPDRGATSAQPRRWCYWIDLSDAGGTIEGGLIVVTPVEGQAYLVLCFQEGDDGPFYTDFRVFDPSDPGAGVVTTIETVAAYAVDRLAIEEPEIETSPPADSHVVAVESWFWPATLDAAVPLTVAAQAGPLWAIAEAYPVGIVVDPADGTGEVVECTLADAIVIESDDGPTCGRYTYQHSSRFEPDELFHPSVTVDYDVYLTTGDNDAGVVIGPVLVDQLTAPTTVLNVRVWQLEPVIH